MPNSHQGRSQRAEPGLPLPWIFHIIIPYSLEPREKGFPHAHDALLTLFLAWLAVIRVELGVRRLEHTRGGWGLMPDVKGLTLENPGYVPDSQQRDKTVLWRRVGC